MGHSEALSLTGLLHLPQTLGRLVTIGLSVPECPTCEQCVPNQMPSRYLLCFEIFQEQPGGQSFSI